MKLIKRTQPEKGMVYESIENGTLFVWDNVFDKKYQLVSSCAKYKFSKPDEHFHKIVGKIGFNYKWEDGKLEKIKLPDVSADDVFETDIEQSFVSHSTETNPKNKVQGNWFDIDGSILTDKNTDMRVGYLIEDMKHKGNLAYNYKIEGGV